MHPCFSDGEETDDEMALSRLYCGGNVSVICCFLVCAFKAIKIIIVFGPKILGICTKTDSTTKCKNWTFAPSRRSTKQ